VRVRPFCLRIRSVGAAGDDELPSRANGLQARQGVQDFLRGMRKDVLRFQPFSVKSRLSHSLTAGSPRAPPALAAQLRAFSVIPSSLRAELSTSRNHSVGKVSAEPIFLLIVRIRSLYVSGIAEDDGSCVTVHFRNVCLGEARLSTLHRPCGQRSAARHSPLAGQARTPLRLRSIASAPDLPEKR